MEFLLHWFGGAYSAIDATLITAWGTTVAAVAAVYTSVTQGRSYQKTLALQMIQKLDDEFHSARFHAFRRGFATKMRDNRTTGVSFENSPDADHLLQFFEGLGYYVDQKAITLDMSWQFFSYYMFRFHSLAKVYIEYERTARGDPTLWEYYLKLHESLQAYERKKIGRYPVLSENVLRTFLDDESSIIVRAIELPAVEVNYR